MKFTLTLANKKDGNEFADNIGRENFYRQIG